MCLSLPLPQPLLVSTWATNSYDAVSAIMDLTPDTTVLYSPDKALTPAPVTFHVSTPVLQL